MQTIHLLRQTLSRLASLCHLWQAATTEADRLHASPLDAQPEEGGSVMSQQDAIEMVGPFGPFLTHDQPMMGWVETRNGHITRMVLAPPSAEYVGGGVFRTRVTDEERQP